MSHQTIVGSQNSKGEKGKGDKQSMTYIPLTKTRREDKRRRPKW